MFESVRSQVWGEQKTPRRQIEMTVTDSRGVPEDNSIWSEGSSSFGSAPATPCASPPCSRSIIRSPGGSPGKAVRGHGAGIRGAGAGGQGAGSRGLGQTSRQITLLQLQIQKASRELSHAKPNSKLHAPLQNCRGGNRSDLLQTTLEDGNNSETLDETVDSTALDNTFNGISTPLKTGQPPLEPLSSPARPLMSSPAGSFLSSPARSLLNSPRMRGLKQGLQELGQQVQELEQGPRGLSITLEQEQEDPLWKRLLSTLIDCCLCG